MKPYLFIRTFIQMMGIIVIASLAAKSHAQSDIKGGPTADPVEQRQLDGLFAATHAADAAIQPGSAAGYQRREVARQLALELENFVATHTNSTLNPAVHLWLAKYDQQFINYAGAVEHYAATWALLRDSRDPAEQQQAIEASGGLAMLLALTGRTEELETLQSQVQQLGKNWKGANGWGRAWELHAWMRKHPEEYYKCGLYCLDQLGRMTQPGEFKPQDILETLSSTNGFSAAELVQIASRAGVRVHAAWLQNSNTLPVPSILHLRSGHFVVVRDYDGHFYNIYDTVALGSKWVTAAEIAPELSGCVIVSDAPKGLAAVNLTTAMDAAEAAKFRGRCHTPLPDDHNDTPCDATCPNGCPPGSGGPGGPGGPGKGGTACSTCGQNSGPVAKYSQGDGMGMVSWFVSEPYLNLWLEDKPLSYHPAYGPDVDLKLRFHSRHEWGAVSGYIWQGARLSDFGRYNWMWYCSFLSYAEFSSDGHTLDVMLPGAGWATFNFQTGHSFSDNNYQHNLVAEKVPTGGGNTNFVVHFPDGKSITYGLLDSSYSTFAGVYYMTAQADPAGKATTFSYDANYYLTNVTAADGATFTVHYDDPYLTDLITSITTSYGSSVSFNYTYDTGTALTNITDAAGISSQISGYGDDGGNGIQIITPYGTTSFVSVQGATVFDRIVRATLPDGTQEFYGLISDYTLTGNTDWPNFASSQIPTNTPVGTLDTATRQERNTFYWNAQQFAPYVSTSLTDFNWSIFKNARIRHWLASTDPVYTHFDPTLALEQAPSPDGGTTEGQITWYDQTGKPVGVPYESGNQIMPAVMARVMPDGSTAYTYTRYTANGLATNVVEKWVDASGNHTRTNRYYYAANGVDMTLHLGPNNEQVSSNIFNAYHQVTTNYDALNQATRYTYNSTTHLLTSRITPGGLTTTNYYDGSSRLQKTIDLEISRTNSYTWYSSGDVATHTDERGLVMTNYWDGLHRLTGTAYPDSTTTTNYYTVSSAYPSSTGGLKLLDLTISKDRMNYWTYYGYDARRRQTAVTNANGVITRYGYCDCGAVSYVTNAWNTAVQFVTWYDFDNHGNRIYTHYPDMTVTNWYDALDRPLTTCDYWGCRWYGYDNLSRLVAITNGLGAQEKALTYDIEDRPIYVTDANGVTVTNTYDLLGRLLTRTYPDAGVEKFGYSALGLIAYTNQLGYTNYYGYDAAARKIAETNANAEILRYTNNAAGDLLSLTDGKLQTTYWHYDAYGRVTNKVDQGSVEILRYYYDADNRLTNRWSVEKGYTYYSYDAMANLTNINYPSSPDVQFGYDALNRVTNMVDAVGITKYAYTAGGQLWTEDGPFASDTVTNTYQSHLRTALSLAQPTGAWTNGFGYDGAKHLTGVTSPAGTFTYTLGATADASPLVKKLLLPNTSYITNTYDTVARLTGTWLKTSANSTLDSATYGYNAGNQRTTFTNAAGTQIYYTYDKIGQVTIADSATASEDRGYVYDAAWNLTFRTNNTTLNSFYVDGKNQLTNSTPSGVNQFDGNGNLTNYNNGAVGDIVYTYDDENRMTRAEAPVKHLWATDFVYDGLGRLRKRVEYLWAGANWTPYTATYYLYDGMRVIQERDASNVPTVSYTRGTDLSSTMEGAGGIGGLLARSQGYSGGNWSTHNYYHADGNGNITYLVNSSQALAASYRYDAFGNTLSASGTLAAANVYRFSSKEIHVNTGLYYYGFRWYMPTEQRWLNRDPLGELGFEGAHSLNPLSSSTRELLQALSCPNLYAFVENQPLYYYDPNGLWVTRYPEKIRVGVGGLASTIATVLGGVTMGHCPNWTCHQGTCQACCTAGFAVATVGNVAGAVVGCGGTLGLGCWLNIAISGVAEIGLADSYHSCLTACKSKSK